MHQKAVCLLSGGIDSPVAAWLMKKKGLGLVFLHFNNYSSTESIEKARALAFLVDSKAKFICVDFKPFQEKILSRCNRRYQCILCKRTMYKIAEKIAIRKKARFIITGESIGQVASQTLENLLVLDDATKLHVLRPLLCFDKEETIRIAKKLGTYNLSTQKSHTCPYLPIHPLTKARIENVKNEEKKLYDFMK
ncbi:MAG: 7-cyano-7-deazaguanine synthase [Candidatus Woesearchaeota archaeon]